MEVFGNGQELAVHRIEAAKGAKAAATLVVGEIASSSYFRLIPSLSPFDAAFPRLISNSCLSPSLSTHSERESLSMQEEDSVTYCSVTTQVRCQIMQKLNIQVLMHAVANVHLLRLLFVVADLT